MTAPWLTANTLRHIAGNPSMAPSTLTLDQFEFLDRLTVLDVDQSLFETSACSTALSILHGTFTVCLVGAGSQSGAATSMPLFDWVLAALGGCLLVVAMVYGVVTRQQTRSTAHVPPSPTVSATSSEAADPQEAPEVNEWTALDTPRQQSLPMAERDGAEDDATEAAAAVGGPVKRQASCERDPLDQ